MNLNEQQKLAVSHYLGTCVVTAVPGSGKTRVLTSRAVSLIKDKGVDPRNILCLTFTNKASNEMKERILSEFNARPDTQLIIHDLDYCKEDLTPIGQTKIERMPLWPNLSMNWSLER